MVMVLNALGLPAPVVPEYEPYRTFTQDNVLSEQTDAVLPRETLGRQGMTLDQLGGILATQPVKAEVHHAADSSVDEFRKLASAYLGEPGHFVIVNYLRKALGERPAVISRRLPPMTQRPTASSSSTLRATNILRSGEDSRHVPPPWTPPTPSTTTSPADSCWSQRRPSNNAVRPAALGANALNLTTLLVDAGSFDLVSRAHNLSSGLKHLIGQRRVCLRQLRAMLQSRQFLRRLRQSRGAVLQLAELPPRAILRSSPRFAQTHG